MAIQTTARGFEILLVEDSPADVRLTEEALKEGKVPHHLRVAGDGVEALAFLRREKRDAGTGRPDLILLDLNLPRKDGRELLEEIKSDPDLKQIPVVILTTSCSGKDILKGYELQANYYMTKPADVDQLITIIKSVEPLADGGDLSS